MALPIFPIADFGKVIEQYAARNAVNMPVMAYFDFRAKPMGLWGGEYNLTSETRSGGSVTWQGLGKSGVLIGIEGLADESNLDSSDMKFTVSGVDSTTLSVFSGENRADYVSRLVGVYIQFFDSAWQALCPPFTIRAGIMGVATVTRQQEQDGSWTRKIELPASNIFYGRGNAPQSFFTDRDQQMRHPGDEFFTFVPALQDTSIPVPWH